MFRALIIANSRFTDPAIAPLQSPESDAKRLADLLRRPEIGGYSIALVLNAENGRIRREVHHFFDDASADDLNLVLISTHGIKDRWGKLYFAAADTETTALSATAIESRFVIERMDESASERQVLLLDACYSGAFNKGVIGKAATDKITRHDFGQEEHLSGKAIITASTAIQQAGEAMDSGVVQSLFTRHLIEGIETGAADPTMSGHITLGALFKHIAVGLRRDAPTQRPEPHFHGTDGSMVIANNPISVTLAPELEASFSNPLPMTRAGAADELIKLTLKTDRYRPLAITKLRSLLQDDSTLVKTVAQNGLARLGIPEQEVPEPDAGTDHPSLVENPVASSSPLTRVLESWNTPVLPLPKVAPLSSQPPPDRSAPRDETLKQRILGTWYDRAENTYGISPRSTAGGTQTDLQVRQIRKDQANSNEVSTGAGWVKGEIVGFNCWLPLMGGFSGRLVWSPELSEFSLVGRYSTAEGSWDVTLYRSPASSTDPPH